MVAVGAVGSMAQSRQRQVPSTIVAVGRGRARGVSTVDVPSISATVPVLAADAMGDDDWIGCDVGGVSGDEGSTYQHTRGST